MVGECMGELLINHEAVDFPEKLLRVTISSEKSSGVWRASVTMATQFLLLPPVTETSKTRHNTQSTQSLISKWKGNYVVSLWEKQLWNVKWCKIGHNWTYFRVQAERLGKTNGRQTPFCSGGICSEMKEKNKFAQKCKENMDMLNVFSCPQQLNRWPCHSLTHWLNHWLTHGTFTFDIQRATQETC